MRRAIAAGAAVMAGFGLVGCKDYTPIMEQNCHQLAATERHLVSVIQKHPGGIDSEGRIAESDGELLNLRVTQLGGCPEEPDLR